MNPANMGWMSDKRYASDLTDKEYAILEPLLPKPKRRGRRRSVVLHEIINGIFYILRGGVPWRMLPGEFPPWKTVFDYFRQWRLSGLWQTINGALRERAREAMGRRPQPTASIIDSQSVTTTEMGGPRGDDGGKKINGRKRHLVVDTQGLLLKAKVLPADLHDRPAAELVLVGLHRPYPGIRLMWADTAYRGLADWLDEQLGWTLEITRHWWTGARVWVAAGQPPPERPAGFQVLKRRWVVERTFAWLGRNRRLSKDYERLCETTETWIYLAMTKLMLRRLTAK
jgi:putative transposase